MGFCYNNLKWLKGKRKGTYEVNQGNQYSHWLSWIPVCALLVQVQSQARSCLLFQHPALEESCSVIHSPKSIEFLLCWHHTKHLEHKDEQNSGTLIIFLRSESMKVVGITWIYTHGCVITNNNKKKQGSERMECECAKDKDCCYIPAMGTVLPPRRNFGNLWEHFVCLHNDGGI